jgi:hypothetical protein
MPPTSTGPSWKYGPFTPAINDKSRQEAAANDHMHICYFPQHAVVSTVDRKRRQKSRAKRRFADRCHRTREAHPRAGMRPYHGNPCHCAADACASASRLPFQRSHSPDSREVMMTLSTDSSSPKIELEWAGGSARRSAAEPGSCGFGCWWVRQHGTAGSGSRRCRWPVSWVVPRWMVGVPSRVGRCHMREGADRHVQSDNEW